MVLITADPIDINLAWQHVQTGQAGAVNFFFGIVRDNTDTLDTLAKPVERLEYEAYDRMAISEMQKIVDDASRRWPVLRSVVIHRKGSLCVGDMAVLIGVATPHRAESFAACQYIIDTIKQTVPIWKKEFFQDGAVWVNAHP